jgi:hypothetical protein
MSRLRKVMAKSRMGVQYMFKRMDKDDSGSLDFEEIMIGMEEHVGVKLSPQELAEVIAFIDEDNSGEISFKELDRSIRETNKERSQRVHNHQNHHVRNVGYSMSPLKLEQRLGIASDVLFARKGLGNFKDPAVKAGRKEIDDFCRKPTLF